MFKKIAKMITGRSRSSDSQSKIAPSASEVKEGFSKVFGLITKYFSDTVAEIKIMKEKSNNLLQTNVSLGLRHLNNDMISDAIFRFKIITIFWPNFVKSYYYLAHCYTLKKKYSKAENSIKKLLEMDPSYESRVAHMVNKINLAKNDGV